MILIVTAISQFVVLSLDFSLQVIKFCKVAIEIWNGESGNHGHWVLLGTRAVGSSWFC